MHIHFEIFQSNNTDHMESARRLAKWSQAGDMLPLTPYSMAQHPYGLLAVGSWQTPLGYVAVTRLEAGTARIGGLVVNPSFRQRGIGRLLVSEVIATAGANVAQAERFEAYANRSSFGLFLAAGGQPVGRRTYDVLSPPNGCNIIFDLTAPVHAASAV